MLAAAVVVLLDHRATLRDLGLPARAVWRRWMTYGRLAERLVVARDGGTEVERQVLEGAHVPVLR